MGKGGEDQFDDLLFQYNPELVVVDILAKLKWHNTGQYDAEYQAMTEIKELIDKHDKDCLVLTIQESQRRTIVTIRLITLSVPQPFKVYLIIS